jgi:hypothetical protein
MKNWRECGGKLSWPNFKILSQNLPGKTDKNTKNPTQASRSPSRILSPIPPEYEAGVLTTPSQRRNYVTVKFKNLTPDIYAISSRHTVCILYEVYLTVLSSSKGYKHRRK